MSANNVYVCIYGNGITYCYSGDYKFWPVLLYQIIDSSGSLKKVDNSK